MYARVAQLVEHDLAKVGVAGSSPVSRLGWDIPRPMVVLESGDISQIQSVRINHSGSRKGTRQIKRAITFLSYFCKLIYANVPEKIWNKNVIA